MKAEDPRPTLEPHQVRDGARVLRFDGWRLAHTDSSRPGVPRWTQIEIYRLISGGYVISKVGRSTVAHRPDCARVTSRMTSFIDLRDHREMELRRTPCPECRPEVGERMDPQTLLEASRYRAFYVYDAEGVVDTLLEERPAAALPQVMRRAIREAAAVDDDIAKTWSAQSSSA